MDRAGIYRFSRLAPQMRIFCRPGGIPVETGDLIDQLMESRHSALGGPLNRI